MPTFLEYLQRFNDDQTPTGAIARKTFALVEQGRTINSLTDLLIWLGPTEHNFTYIEKYPVGESHLRNLWCEYCAACNHPL